MEFLIGFILIFGIYLFFSNRRTQRMNDQIRENRSKEIDKIFSEFPTTKGIDRTLKQKANKSMLTASIITGVPVQNRYGDGSLTGAGAQQIAWCSQMLQDMENRKSKVFNVTGGKRKFTREEIEKHLASI